MRSMSVCFLSLIFSYMLTFFRVKKGKCDGKKPVCTRCALDGQICMFSERKFSKDRVIPKGYIIILIHCSVFQLRRTTRKSSRGLRNWSAGGVAASQCEWKFSIPSFSSEQCAITNGKQRPRSLSQCCL